MKKRRLVRIKGATEITGLSKTGVYERIEEGTFPRQIKVGRVSLWPEDELYAWVDEQVKKRDQSANR